MTRRAEAEERTKRRITESTVELHRILGPARTTVSAIAGHAGVRRSTVYRHFPDEASLFAACTAHWRAANPTPAIGPWTAVQNPDERLRVALEELYRYYRRTEEMLSSILRDSAMPVVKESLAGYEAYLAAARDALMVGRMAKGPAKRQVHAALGHALAFSTWRSLAHDQGLTNTQAAVLMCRMVEAAAGRSD